MSTGAVSTVSLPGAAVSTMTVPGTTVPDAVVSRVKMLASLDVMSVAVDLDLVAEWQQTCVVRGAERLPSLRERDCGVPRRDRDGVEQCGGVGVPGGRFSGWLGNCEAGAVIEGAVAVESTVGPERERASNDLALI